MSYAEAEQVFATARFPDRGKPLPGKEVRLWQEEDGDYYVTYHDSPVVTINRDGTYLLDHNGYPTPMTEQRMHEYAPVRLGQVGKRHYRGGRYYALPYHTYDNLALHFPCPIPEVAGQQSLLHLYFPERFERSCWLEFPREKLLVDGNGLPVIEFLLGEIAPREWKHRLENRLQAWELPSKVPGASAPLPPAEHALAYQKRWPQEPRRGHGERRGQAGQPRQIAPAPVDARDSHLVMLRRKWAGNLPVASIWIYQGRHGSPLRYRWLIPRLGLSGQSSRLELAIKRVDRELRRAGGSSAPPLLTDVLGNLRHRLGEPISQPGQPPLPFGPRLMLQQPVLRAHWMEPWETSEHRGWRGEHYFAKQESRRLPRRPLAGARPWPGHEEVRVWFELVDGTAVGIAYDSKTKQDEVLVRRAQGGSTEWAVPGVLAAGLLATVMAWYTGRIG